jgi:transcriptional regulator with PAS, ATPase and Fis domain
VKDRVGRFELADGGTLFLDEVGDMSLPLQAKILRALQEHTFERVGDTKTRKVDVRVVAATNENLALAVQENRFREDLYYRLRVVPIEIPPLRERREDIEAITRHLLHRIGASRGRALRLAPTAMDALMSYTWPGNVRELENALEFATTVCEGQTIHLKHLPLEVRAAGVEGIEPPAHAPASTTPGIEPRPVRTSDARPDDRIPDHLSPSEAAEARDILDALSRAQYNRQDAAKILGVSRTTLWRKMKQYGL